MDWTEVIARVITLDTFGNIWFWAAVVVSWAVAAHWMIGVPFDLLVRARQSEGPEVADLEKLVDINVRRIVWLHERVGLGAVALAAFFVAGIGLLAIGYRFELAMGVFMLGVPLLGVAAMNVRLALQLHHAPLRGQDLVRRLFRARLWTQVAAALSLFFTAVFGMAYNIVSLSFL